MRDVFWEVLSRSITAGWLVLAVAALRLILKRAPRRVSVLLWGMVALRLLCPVSIESRFSLVPQVQALTQRLLAEAGLDQYAGTALSPGNVSGNLSGDMPGTVPGIVPGDAAGTAPGKAAGEAGAPEPGAEDGPFGIGMLSTDSRLPSGGPLLFGKWNIIDVLPIVWMIGAVSMGLYALLAYLRLRKLVSTAVVMRDNIFQSEAVDSPFVLGVVRPRIYIPFRIEGRNLVHVVMHEQVHILRRDYWWKPLGFVVLSVYWFHPLMWLAYILLCRDIELACDERAIKELDDGQRADYSRWHSGRRG